MTASPLADLPRVVEKQREYFAAGKTRDVQGRLEALKRLQEALEANEEEILRALAADLGKPAIEAFLAEYHFLLQEIRLLRRSLTKWLRPRRVANPFYFWPCRSEVVLEPHGTVLVMAPWNYPLQLSLSPLMAAVAAGNTVVLKPSEHAPASAALLGKLLAQVFPPEHVAVVAGGAEVSSALLEHAFDFLFFTGSTAVGKIVAEKAAQHLTPHILELGGKCPCVVEESADLALAARRILVGKLFNAGQTCFAPDFIAVHENARDALVHELHTLLDALPWEKEMARIVNPGHFARLEGLVTGEVLQKGQDDRDALHFAPRILPRAHWDDPAMQEEVFGPLLPVVPYPNRDELIARLRDFPTPLALYCFSRDEEFIAALLAAVPSGSVGINDIGKQASNLNLPFGGSGASGHGRYRGKTSVLAFSQERAITRRYFVRDVFETLPPRARKEKFLRKWLR